MFDVGFSELLVIAVVALVVIGPERLPKVARTAGHLLGRLQRYVSDVKADINREIQLEELKKLQQQVSTQMTGVEATVTQEIREVENSLNQVAAPLADAAVPPAPTPEATTPTVAVAAENTPKS
jgi:sec-independent protein translocase protein TatB